jgi:hypothetical protein
MMHFIKNVGELKEYLKTLPDDLPIVKYRSNMEKSGYFEGVHAVTATMSKETHDTYDAFDYTPYTYESYALDQHGEIQTLIL